MTTEIEREQAARVARLAQRRAASGGGRAAPRADTPDPSTTRPAASAPTPAPAPAATPLHRPPVTPAWEPPAQYRPVRYTQPIAITVAQATHAAAASAGGASSTVPMNAAAQAAAGSVHAVAATPDIAVVDRATALPVTRSRRRHAAAAGRVVATGLATSGFLGTITALAQADAHSDEATTPAPDTTTVTIIEKTVYVDEFGNPVAPPSSLAAVTTDPAVTDTTAPGETTVPGTTVAGQVPVTTAAGQPAPAPTPAPSGGGTPAPAPVTTAKAAAPAPAPVTTTKAPAPAPVTTAPAPVTTKAPATTQPPAPATTQPPPPPATTVPPPACTGSKC